MAKSTSESIIFHKFHSYKKIIHNAVTPAEVDHFPSWTHWAHAVKRSIKVEDRASMTYLMDTMSLPLIGNAEKKLFPKVFFFLGLEA